MLTSVFSLQSSVSRRVVAALVLSATASCAITPPPPDGWAAEHAALLELDEWSLKGRIAVSTADGGANGSIAWRQNADWMSFSFRGPLGAGSFHLQGDDQSLRVTTADGGDRLLEDPAHELEDALGFNVPYDHMRYWIRGVPSPREPAEKEFDDDGRLTGFAQAGWAVSYRSYSIVGDRTLPKRLNMENGAVRLKFIIHRWTLVADEIDDQEES